MKISARNQYGPYHTSNQCHYWPPMGLYGETNPEKDNDCLHAQFSDQTSHQKDEGPYSAHY